MGLIEEIKDGLKTNPVRTIYCVAVYLPCVAITFLAALTFAISVTIFNLSLSKGLEAFREIMSL